ncbi:hypothetical protein Tco_0694241 [Tanacetum coccineum]
MSNVDWDELIHTEMVETVVEYEDYCMKTDKYAMKLIKRLVVCKFLYELDLSHSLTPFSGRQFKELVLLEIAPNLCCNCSCHLIGLGPTLVDDVSTGDSLMLFGVIVALIDVNAAQSKLVLLENFNENYSKCLRLLVEVTTASTKLLLLEEVTTASGRGYYAERLMLLVKKLVLLKCQIVDNCKKGLGYNAVPPPYTGNFMPPKPDLSFTGLDEFANKHVVENYKAISSKEEPKEVRKNDDAPIIEEWVSDSEEENGNPQMDLQDKGVIDSGCSRHMTGIMSYLTDYKEIDGGYISFGGNPKEGKITGKAYDLPILLTSPNGITDTTFHGIKQHL